MPTAFSPTIDEFLLRHHVMSLAMTEGEAPWAASVFYVFDIAGRRLIFFTSPATRHGSMLVRNARAAGTIAGQQRDIATLCGLQFEGTAAMLDEPHTREAEALFAAAFPGVSAHGTPLWALSPTMLKLTNNALGFGFKEIWKG